jgi:hypothetical protein
MSDTMGDFVDTWLTNNVGWNIIDPTSAGSSWISQG